MTFCYSPWTNIDISPQGDISPCCKFQMSKYNQKFDVQNHTLAQYLGSEFLNKVKQDFQQGQWPQGCERCQIEEMHNIQSKRQLDFARWSKHYDKNPNKIITASIAFGNTCNLKCITCNPYSSSRWQSEYKSIYNIEFDSARFYRDDFVENFAQQASELVHLDIPGGEPLISGVPEQQRLLTYYIDTNQAQNISLHYTTNATVFADQTWWNLWQHFKEVDLQLSVDGIDRRYEYIRYPGNWNMLVNNVQKYLQSQTKQFRLSISHTVSAYNIYYLDEFFDWCYSIGLPRPWLGRVHNPKHMRPTVWPNKNFIVDKLNSSQHADVKNWISLLQSQDDSQHFELFRSKVVEHDRYRGIDFATTFPELANLLR